MSKKKNQYRLGRIVSIDLHPDIFSSCLMRGTNNDTAVIEMRFNEVPVSRMEKWARKNLRQGDLVVMESGSNSFEAVRRFEALGLTAVVLESARVGRVADSFVDNDTMAAERIARCYLTGMSKTVWVPDETTSERRALLHAYLSATRAETRAVNELRGFLTQYQVRLEKRNPRNAETHEWILAQREWTPMQLSLLEHHFEKLTYAMGESEKLYVSICREVLADAMMSGCLRVLGIGPINAFAAVATVGDINRFSSPEKLVNYLALHPGRKQSGNGKDWRPGTGKRGRREMRCLLVQAAQVVMRQKDGASDLRDWGWRLYLRKGNKNIAVVAVARKLAMQLWHLMKGGCTTHKDQQKSLKLKTGRLFRLLDTTTRIELGYQEKVSDCIAEFMKKIDLQPVRTI